MSNKQKKLEIVNAIQDLAKELGRVPTRDEFRQKTGLEHQMELHYGGYSIALHAAGYVDAAFGKGPKQPRKFKYKVEKLQGFFVHNYDLKDLFKQAGNPPVLKMIAQPDTHIPYEDKPAVEALLEFAEFYKPHIYTIMGDYGDCAGMSHWPSSDSKPRRFVPEALAVRKYLERTNKAIDKNVIAKFYLKGNHEDWIDQALNGKIPELMDGIDQLGLDISLNSIFKLEEYGYELIPLNHLLQLGKAHFTHGLYTNDNHPKKHLDVFKCNIYYGHLHDVKKYNQTSINGHMEAATLGCLSRLDPSFLKGRPNNWVHSFGVFEFFPDGTYTWYLPKIFNGRFSFMGRVFDGN